MPVTCNQREVHVPGNTIVATHFEGAVRLRPLVFGPAAPAAERASAELARRLFKIRAASTDGVRSSASILVSRMYAWRGYQTSPTAVPLPDPHNRVTLVAEDCAETVGTISVGFDGPGGLFVDQLFADEVAGLRAEGRSLCEFTKLAMDSIVKSKRVLASLFHVAYIYAYRLNGFDSLLIEVNPRHVRYYERMLGFRPIGPERLNPRVNAPAVLLCLDLLHAQRQIDRFGGRSKAASTERSLYPYFFSVEEEAGIVGRLRCDPALRPVVSREGSASASFA